MAKRHRATPHPPSKTSPKLVSFGVGALWRVHPASYRAAEFNPGKSGNARFSPIRRPDGAIIPVLYGASTLAGAIMETVFHDVPTPPGGYILDIERLREQDLVVSRVRPKRRLQAVDLSTKGLKRLGLHRTDLVDTPVTAYPLTRDWAEWLHGATRAAGLPGPRGRTMPRARLPYSATDSRNQRSNSKSTASRCAKPSISTHCLNSPNTSESNGFLDCRVSNSKVGSLPRLR